MVLIIILLSILVRKFSPELTLSGSKWAKLTPPRNVTLSGLIWAPEYKKKKKKRKEKEKEKTKRKRKEEEEEEEEKEEQKQKQKEKEKRKKKQKKTKKKSFFISFNFL